MSTVGIAGRLQVVGYLEGNEILELDSFGTLGLGRVHILRRSDVRVLHLYGVFDKFFFLFVRYPPDHCRL